MHEPRQRVHLSLELPVEIDIVLGKLASQLGSTKNEVVCQAIGLMQKTTAESLLAEQADHRLAKLMETFGTWESNRTLEEVVEDIYTSRTTSDISYPL